MNKKENVKGDFTFYIEKIRLFTWMEVSELEQT